LRVACSLLTREDRTLAGVPRIEPSLGADPIALFIYDRRGHFAAQFMKRNRDVAVDATTAPVGPNNRRPTADTTPADAYRSRCRGVHRRHSDRHPAERRRD
jgi:hypothetical protein